MIKHFPVSNIYSVSIHILTSITTITSVICFRTVNASGKFIKTNINAPFSLPKGEQFVIWTSETIKTNLLGHNN